MTLQEFKYKILSLVKRWKPSCGVQRITGNDGTIRIEPEDGYNLIYLVKTKDEQHHRYIGIRREETTYQDVCKLIQGQEFIVCCSPHFMEFKGDYTGRQNELHDAISDALLQDILKGAFEDAESINMQDAPSGETIH